MRANVLTAAVALGGWLGSMAQAQEIRIEVPARAVSPMGIPMPGQPVPGQPMPGQPVPGMPAAPMPGQPMPGAKSMESATPAVVNRPAKPDKTPDPEEMKLTPDAEGKVRFNFEGQPWPDVLKWLAKTSGLSLDWLELPGGHLNLRTQRTYTLEEARDLINRHLLDRGFTMLKNGEVLTVVNLKKLDPSLVPRVAPDDLAKCRPHEFVKVSFPLRSLMAEGAVEEFKPMLSPHGKISALKGSNRIEVLDAAANLQEIAAVVSQEQSGGAPKRVFREFRLQYRRAAEVHEMLKGLLGLDGPAAGGAPQDPQQAQQMAMQQMMMAQQQAQQGQPQPPPGAAPKIRLVVDTRENSVLAHAPADQMAVIAEAIETVDVPSDKTGSLLKNLNRMQVYRLNSIDPEALVKVLQDMGEMDPATTLKADKTNRSLMVNASLADHLTIRALVDKLDGTGRKFEVVRLRRLEAEHVAGTIEFLMGAGDKKKQRNPFAMYEFNPWGGYQRSQEPEESSKFKVDADTENNRLLLFANEVELKEIHQLLIKLGEIPSENEAPRTYRILDVDPKEGNELLRRLRSAWPSVGPNRLIVPQEMPEPEAEQPPPPERPADAAKRRPVKPASARIPDRNLEARELAQIDDEDLDDSEEPPAGSPQENGTPQPERPPITVTRGPDGRILFRSEDTQALDMLEDLSTELSPPRKDYKLIQLKYPSTWAYGVVLNLKEFFDDENKDDRNERRLGWMMGFGSGVGDSDTTRRLSKRRPLKFISDSDTNTILVVGADPQQMKVIEELVEMYDQPPANENKSVRKTQLFTLKYAKARVVAEAIKDVYRDLLSVNDKAMQQNQTNDEKQRPASERSYTFIYGGGEEDGEKPETPIKFKGLLSLGVDEESNTLIVSAAEGLLENVAEMIQKLEDAAQPRATSLQVLSLKGRVDSASLQEKLQKLMGRPGNPPGQPQPGQPQPGQVVPGQNQPNGQQPAQGFQIQTGQ